MHIIKSTNGTEGKGGDAFYLSVHGCATLCYVHVQALSTYGAANGSAFSGGRLVYAAAINGDFSSCLGELLSWGKDGSPVPARALFFQTSIAIMMVMAGDFENLLAGFNVAAWTFYLQAVSCLYAFPSLSFLFGFSFYIFLFYILYLAPEPSSYSHIHTHDAHGKMTNPVVPSATWPNTVANPSTASSFAQSAIWSMRRTAK